MLVRDAGSDWHIVLQTEHGELAGKFAREWAPRPEPFASLLTVVFSQRFATISSLQRGAYVLTLLSTACAVALLVGPVAFHRIVFRHSQKDDLVRVSHRMALGGLGCLAVSMVAVVLFILEEVLGKTPAIWYSAGVGVVFLLLWLVIPVVSRTREEMDGDD